MERQDQLRLAVAVDRHLQGLSQLATAVPGLIVGPIVGCLKDRKALVFGLSAFTGLSVLGLILSPQNAALWAVAFAASAGAAFPRPSSGTKSSKLALRSCHSRPLQRQSYPTERQCDGRHLS